MMKEVFGLIGNDWEKIPQNYRYLLLAGGFFVFNSWLLDHWNESRSWIYWGLDFPQISYFIGLILIVLGFTILVFRQFMVFANIWNLRRKYPISGVNKDFYIFNFGDPWYLFDNRSKQYFHIVPYSTVRDLHFEGLNISVQFDKGKIAEFVPGLAMDVRVGKGKWISIDKFSNAGIINTKK